MTITSSFHLTDIAKRNLHQFNSTSVHSPLFLGLPSIALVASADSRLLKAVIILLGHSNLRPTEQTPETSVMPETPTQTNDLISPHDAFPTDPAYTQVQNRTPARTAYYSRRAAKQLRSVRRGLCGLSIWSVLILPADGTGECGFPLGGLTLLQSRDSLDGGWPF